MADILDFPQRPAKDDAANVEAQAIIDGEYLGGEAIDLAEGNYKAARAALLQGMKFVTERELMNRANRLLGHFDNDGPEAA
jgi:hypothetical protein